MASGSSQPSSANLPQESSRTDSSLELAACHPVVAGSQIHGRCSLKPCPCEEAPAIAEYYCVPIFTAPLLHYHRPSLSSLGPNSAPVTDDSAREGQYPQVFLAAQLPARTTSRAAVVAQVCMMLHLCAPHRSPTNARTTTARAASSHQHLPTLQRGRT